MYTISINPMAAFVTATPGKKRALVKQQKYPSPIFVGRYVTARFSMRKYIKNGLSTIHIYDGLRKLAMKVPESKFQEGDKASSIEALEKFLTLSFPDEFSAMKFEYPTTDVKVLTIEGVNILVSPDVIMKWERDGKTFIGGIKLHISKTGVFAIVNSQCAAAGIQMFLEENVAKSGEIVDPNLCLSIDVFGERVTPAPLNSRDFIDKIAAACQEVKRLWDAA